MTKKRRAKPEAKGKGTGTRQAQAQASAAASLTAVEPTPLLVTRREAMGILGGVAERTFATLEAGGIVAPVTRGRGGRASIYDLRQLVPAYIAYVSAQRPSNDRDARAERDRTQAEINKMRLSRDRGDLISKSKAIAEGQEVVAAAKARLLALPSQLLQQGVVTRENQSAVAAIIRRTLDDLARWPPVAEAIAS